jgi:NDP-sugar pyrophosphorylase family protein
MTVFENEGMYDTSNVWFEGGQIRVYDKRNRLPQMRHIDYGLGMFRPDSFADFPQNEPVDLADVQKALLAQGELAGFEVRERFYEVGSPAGLTELDRKLRGP